ncbi:MAG: metallopeptidase family protein [Actinomycetaceae bacterium]|nr:metallopeptidase family protein [Arcanobacterium sp.]MDD7505170.1 metallopeptidase family protein [Actinomycetaceae bacterium]MDY6143840.1 metallopeptidase family protein [Arcanobacterium sp.]
MSDFRLPSRTGSRRRDRHGRGLRGPMIPVTLPAWRSRSEMFDDVISWDVRTFRKFLGSRLDHFEFAVLDVPHSDPAPWERGVPLGRYFPLERPSKIHGRIIFYRMPIVDAASKEYDPRMFIHGVVTEQIANALGVLPEDIDYLQ